MVENGKIDPGISRLKRIADGLEITIVDLFQTHTNQKVTDQKVIVRKQERVQGEFPHSRTRIEILVPQLLGKQMDARLAIIQPEGSSAGEYKHPGEEFGLVLAGALELVIGGVTYELVEGDSFYFDSNRSHRFRNPGPKETVVVWVNHPPSF
jgi:quercetin dioxygenase-like cupin family protein